MPEPARLGKYQVLGVLGEGAMGIVYKGYDPVIERLVAIKTVRKGPADSPLAAHSVARFKNEAKAAGRLQHPNIVGVYEFGEDKGEAFIAMEYVEGTGLRDYLSRQADFDLRQILAIMKQLLQALDFAHGRGVIHRDIKPTNLILTAQGALKVADFGIAHIDASELTLSGTVLGTPAYMSPEQIQGRTIDGRSDLYSAGVVLYELLTGEPPFVGTLSTIAYKTCHEDPVPPSRCSSMTLPPRVDAVVARALAKSVETRFQTAREFSDALEQAFDASTEITVPVPPPASKGTGAGTRSGTRQGTADLLATLATRGSGDVDGRGTAAAPPLEEAFVNQAAAKLAVYLGPVSSWVTKKAARQANSRQELVQILAGNLGAQERRAFLKDMGFPDV